MILYRGKLIDSHVESRWLDSLYEDCVETLSTSSITKEQVISACDSLYHRVMAGEYDGLVRPLLQAANISQERFQQMARLFSREELEYKCSVELGKESLSPLKDGTRRKRYPLGILFHIAAGNVDGLPAYSVIEGLLCGNINILKLPAGDNGLSVRLLYELIREEPALKDYIYVFDVPSAETQTLQRFADIADAIIVWGGDEALAAARRMADGKTRIIPWGHKLSFAYVTEQAREEELYRLAQHICETEQVFCSSCQGLFVDTEDETVLRDMGERFFALLKKTNAERGKADIGMRGKNTIRLYNDKLEKNDWQILNDEGVSVIIKNDSELELSYLFRNVWVKALPRKSIIRQLKKHKQHLQTCGLLCGEAERMELEALLSAAGLTRITKGDQSRMTAGEAHDGMYPLRQYSRVVEME